MATKTVVSNQKKRALEALERRFAVAKVEAQHQQIRNKKRCHELDQGLKSAAGPSKSSLEAAPAGKKDLEAESLTYSCISQPVHDNLLSAIEIPNKEKSTVEKILHELLQKGDSAQKYVQGSRGVKVDNWILLDNFVQGHSTSAAQLQALWGNSKRSRNHMSLKQLKKHGLLNLPEEYHKYESFMPMHEMWKEYVMQLLKNAGKNQVAQCLLGADLHGAILRVVECKVDSLIGVVGIMIRETAETFGIITQDNKFRVVPKRSAVFMLQADCWKITLHGDKYPSRILGSHL